jgi:choline kinase
MRVAALIVAAGCSKRLAAKERKPFIKLIDKLSIS